MTRRVRIAVLAGGRSSEHEISLASARSVLKALDPERYEVVPVLLGRDGSWTAVPDDHLLAALQGEELPPAATEGAGTALVPGAGASSLVRQGGSVPVGQVDVVFPVLHGPFGEDGTVQGLLETLGVPYVGSGVLGSAVSMDKDICKAVLRDAGIPVIESMTLRDGRDDPADPTLPDRVGARLGWPVFVKPATLGSSVGISKVAGPDGLADALRLAYAHDPKVLVEAFAQGREVECGVLGDDDPIASAVAEILPNADWYDYAAKYEPGGSEIVIPADLDEADAERIRDTSLRAFTACECSGMARVDFFLCHDGRLLLNEINTIPGFTETSVYASLFGAIGISYSELVDRLVEIALARHARRARYRF